LDKRDVHTHVIIMTRVTRYKYCNTCMGLIDLFHYFILHEIYGPMKAVFLNYLVFC
jgi:hypothetical protein